MIHFSQDEASLIALAAAWNNPEAVALAKHSTETWIALQFSVPGHGDMLIYLSREFFCNLADHVRGNKAEAQPHMDQWVREKIGLSLAEWKISFELTSQMPAEINVQ